MHTIRLALYLLGQVTVFPDHKLLDWHVLVALPESLYPLLQV